MNSNWSRNAGLAAALVALGVGVGGCYDGISGGGPGGGGDGAEDGGGSDGGDGAEDGADDASGAEDDGGIPGECDPLEGLSATNMRRLSHREYENTLAAMLEDLDAETATTIMTGLDGAIAAVPSDAREVFSGPPVVGAVFDAMDHEASQVHIDRYYDVARGFARQVANSEARRAAFFGSCATDADPGNDPACIEAFVDGFGRRALRRPLTPAEHAFFVDDVYADGAAVGAFDRAGAEDLVTAFLLAPQFLYHLEDDGDPLADTEGLVALNAHELASRLSYVFWMAPPDAQLRELADDGSLMSDEVYLAQVDRMLDDPRARLAMDDFFSQWLGLEEVVDPSGSVGLPSYDAFAGADSPSVELHGAMLDEIRDLSRHYLWDEDGRFEDLFVSELSFAGSDELAGLYGVERWQPGGTPPSFPEGERSGVLTRAALLVNGSTRTRPVLKGKRVVEEFLCQTIPPPPDNVSNESDLEPPYTTRQGLEALTEQEGSSCVVCHEQLNPFGYATENYDALGRFRTEEVVYAEDGTELGRLDVDATVDVTLNGEVQTVDGAVQMSALLAEDARAHTCFARHFFRYAYNRAEDPANDGCLIEDVSTRIQDGDSLRSILRSVALSPTFRLRNLED